MTTPNTANTNLVSLYMAAEADTNWGEDPGTSDAAPKGYEIRMTGESLIHNKQTVLSNVIRRDRMRDTISEVAASTSGDIKFELQFRDWELMLTGVLANEWTYLISRTQAPSDVPVTGSTKTYTGTGTEFAHFVVGADVWVSGYAKQVNNGRVVVASIGAAGVSLTVNTGGSFNLANETNAGSVTFKTPKGVFTDLSIGANNTVASSSTNFLTDVNLAVGQWIRMAGWTNPLNNGLFQITAIAANLLTFNTTVLVNQIAGASIVLTAQRLTNGVARKSFLFEKYFSDVNEYMSMPGQRVGQMQMAITTQAIVTGTISFMGKKMVGAGSSVLGETVQAGTSDSLNATSNVANITENGSPLATAVKSMALTVNNNLRMKPQVGAKYPFDIGYGFIDVTGQLQAYFEDLVMFNQFVNHSQASLSWQFNDTGGNSMVFTLPRIYFTNGTPTAEAGNQDVMQPFDFTAVRDLTTNTTIIIDSLAA